jgi:hypothetical protein
MASRDLTSAMASAIPEQLIQVALLADMEFDSGTVYAWTGIGDLSYNSQTYQGVGHFGSISPVSESTDLTANGVTLTLSGVPSALLSAVLGSVTHNNEVTLRLALIDSNGALVVDPYILFKGLMDIPSISDTGETSIIQIQVENRLIDLQRKREIRYTNEAQLALYTGDVGLEYVASLQDKEINWGKSDG